jgi:hypothetical protein
MAGAAAAGLTGCALIPPKPGEPFDPITFNRWYRYAKLYNGFNPNLRFPHQPARNGYTFLDNISKGYTPGVGYTLPTNSMMVAAAPGRVTEFGQIRGTGRAEGGYIRMKHAGPYRTEFVHVGDFLHDPAIAFKRGDPICTVPMKYADIVKIIFTDVGLYADPDNYGEGHSFMRYPEDHKFKDREFPPEFRYESEYDLLKDVKWKFMRQEEIVDGIDQARAHRVSDSLEGKWHNKGGYRETRWTPIEKIRYLSTIVEMYPQEFRGLSKDEHDLLRTEFYKLQPITLTLPFRKY